MKLYFKKKKMENLLWEIIVQRFCKYYLTKFDNKFMNLFKKWNQIFILFIRFEKLFMEKVYTLIYLK